MSVSHETILYVDLDALARNVRYFRSKLHADTKIIAVVKAFAYGHGDIVIAKELENMGIDAFWVADFEEGVNLRKAEIKSAILVANPGYKSYQQFVKYQLEPVIYNFQLLDLFGTKKYPFKVHIKFNTGMNRYGFSATDLDLLAEKLKHYSHLKVESICSHLAAASESVKDEFTQKQLINFEKIAAEFSAKTGCSPQQHILNSAGTLRFTTKQKNMVRLGIGLYGIGEDKYLEPIAQLHSVITHIQKVVKGNSIGYGGDYIAQKNMKIGIIPVGYADGINRKLGDGVGNVRINNIKADIVGKISMDSMLVDVTDVNAKVGDSVIIFDKIDTVKNSAKKIDTISYEILSTLNRRIKRVYRKGTEEGEAR